MTDRAFYGFTVLISVIVFPAVAFFTFLIAKAVL
jgi:hypothetical protein